MNTNIWDEIHMQIYTQVEDQLYRQVRSLLPADVWNQVNGTNDQLLNQVWGQIRLSYEE